MNNFPAMTEAQRQELIEDLQGVIKVETHSVYGYAARIALAALTAKPDVYVSQKTYSGPHLETRVYRVEATKDLTEGYSLYTAPPAPVLRVPDGWIKCSERMPELGATVLVYMDEPIHSATNYAVATYDKYGFSRSKVTRWQPLPQPPEASNEQSNQ